MRRRTAITFVLAGLLTGWATLAWPWCDLGHTIVCEIAFQELNNKARREVIRLIRQDGEFKTFAEACVWPDHPKQRAEEHFINVSRDTSTFSTDACPTA